MAIRFLLADGHWSQAAVSRAIGCGEDAVRHIATRETWKFLPDDCNTPEVGGILLDLLGADGIDAGWNVSWTGDRCCVDSSVRDLAGWGATLGEACCRAAVALGRWPGRQP